MTRNTMITKLFACAVSLAVLVNCQPATSQELPDVVLKRVTASDGSSGLQGWTKRAPPRPSVRQLFTPRNPKFSGAKLFYESSTKTDPKLATEGILKLNGLKQPRFLARKASEKGFVRTIDGHPNAGVNMFFYEGQIDGKPAKAIAYTWSGKVLCRGQSYCTVSHVFMAPTREFETLGGGAVLAVAWLQQDVPSGVRSMRKYGALSPKAATQKLAQYANNWMVGYVRTNFEMMQMAGQNAAINRQVMNSMQSYNNALSQCGGWDCSISQGANGMWSATPD